MEPELRALSENIGVIEAADHLPEIVVYQHIDFGGWSYRTNLNVISFGMVDQISSFVVVSGRWQFYRHRDFVGPVGPVFGPGYYRWVEDVGVPNDQVSSFQCVGF
jgi:hypothetical protein